MSYEWSHKCYDYFMMAASSYIVLLVDMALVHHAMYSYLLRFTYVYIISNVQYYYTTIIMNIHCITFPIYSFKSYAACFANLFCLYLHTKLCTQITVKE